MTLETLARKMMLTPTQAVAIAATIDTAAKSQLATRQEMIEICFRIPSVCEYLASICRKVTA
jgi:hypothetical protein